MQVRKIIKLILNDIANAYIWLAAFYIVSVILSYFIKSLHSFFDWPAFNAIMVVFGILALVSEKGRKMFFVKGKKNKFNNSRKLFINKTSLEKIERRAYTILKNLNKKDYVKIGVIIAILFYSIIQKTNIIDFFILAYALFSILFVIKSRVAAFIALILLILIPVQLIEKKEATAEITAVYAYYFLVISVLIQIGEYYRENKNVLKKNK